MGSYHRTVILGKSELWPKFQRETFIEPEAVCTLMLADLFPHLALSTGARSEQVFLPSSSLLYFAHFLSRLQVGFFPCDCVELINDKLPPSVQSSVPKPGTLHCVARGFAFAGLMDDFMSVCRPDQCVKSTESWWHSWGRSWSRGRRPRSCASEASWRSECSAATWESICTAPNMRVNWIFIFHAAIYSLEFPSYRNASSFLLKQSSVSCRDASTLNIYRLFPYLLVFPLCSCVLAHHDSLHAVPQVVKSCTEFIEKNGVVDGIYRLSGISSNIQKLRCANKQQQQGLISVALLVFKRSALISCFCGLLWAVSRWN